MAMEIQLEHHLQHNGDGVTAIVGQWASREETYWWATIIWWRKQACTVMAMVTVYWSSGGGVAATAQAKWQTWLSFAYVVKWLIEEAYNLLFQHTNFEGFHCTKMPKRRWQRWWMKRCCSCFLEHVCWVIIVRRLCNNHKKSFDEKVQNF